MATTTTRSWRTRRCGLRAGVHLQLDGGGCRRNRRRLAAVESRWEGCIVVIVILVVVGRLSRSETPVDTGGYERWRHDGTLVAVLETRMKGRSVVVRDHFSGFLSNRRSRNDRSIPRHHSPMLCPGEFRNLELNSVGVRRGVLTE